MDESNHQSSSDASPADAMLPAVYRELHGLAAALFARQPDGHTLQPTALVHEAYLRLADQTAPEWRDRAHFFRVAARAMRQILVDHFRSRTALKRGGGAAREGFVDLPEGMSLHRLDFLALDEALERLAAIDPRQAAVVELRFFAGLAVEEAAEVLGVSPRTVEVDWRMAKAWLSRALSEEDS